MKEDRLRKSNERLMDMAIKEWKDNTLTDKELMNIISIILGIREPSDEDIEWAKSNHQERNVN